MCAGLLAKNVNAVHQLHRIIVLREPARSHKGIEVV
jgi:hypothetical protein